jgi:hypothetical protein
MSKYYLIENNSIKGSFSILELKEMNIKINSLLCKEGTNEWKKITEFQELDIISKDLLPLLPGNIRLKKRIADSMISFVKTILNKHILLISSVYLLTSILVAVIYFCVVTEGANYYTKYVEIKDHLEEVPYVEKNIVRPGFNIAVPFYSPTNLNHNKFFYESYLDDSQNYFLYTLAFLISTTIIFIGAIKFIYWLNKNSSNKLINLIELFEQRKDNFKTAYSIKYVLIINYVLIVINFIIIINYLEVSDAIFGSSVYSYNDVFIQNTVTTSGGTDSILPYTSKAFSSKLETKPSNDTQPVKSTQSKTNIIDIKWEKRETITGEGKRRTLYYAYYILPDGSKKYVDNEQRNRSFFDQDEYDELINTYGVTSETPEAKKPTTTTSTSGTTPVTKSTSTTTTTPTPTPAPSVTKPSVTASPRTKTQKPINHYSK